MRFLGIDWVGLTPGNGHRLLLSVAFIAIVVLAGRGLRALVGMMRSRSDDRGNVQVRFWTRQGISLVTAVVLVLGILSIWFSDPARLATAFGLVSAGLAFALQQVVTSIAGYLVILRGNTFTVGDRISMGGVRGDVMRLGFIQTTIMEMGQPPGNGAGPGMWVHSRQFTGRIVSVTNSKIFAEPVFNYTRDFPFIWEELAIPIHFEGDRKGAEAILLEAAHAHAVQADSIAAEKKAELQARFGVTPIDLQPRVYYRITENWLELTVRFVTPTHGTRSIKDVMARDVMDAFQQAGIRIAAPRTDIVGIPRVEPSPPASPSTNGDALR